MQPGRYERYSIFPCDSRHLCIALDKKSGLKYKCGMQFGPEIRAANRTARPSRREHMDKISEKLYRRLAGLILARENCRASGNAEWFEKHAQTAAELVKQHMPSGGGFDSGTTLDLDKSTPERLVFGTAFHHMDESGSYCGWSQHYVTVRPSLWAGFQLTISGRNVRDIKEYIAESFHSALSTEVA